MKAFFVTLPRNIINSFRGHNIYWHFLAIVLTVILVSTGVDWQYFLLTRSPELQQALRPAIYVGALLPIILPLIIILVGILVEKKKVLLYGLAIGQAEFIGWLISSAYKSLTGRIAPPMSDLPGLIDSSHTFLFGFWRGGIFWGWPSSHTAVAFAFAFAIVALFPRLKLLRLVVILYALYIGIGVSVSIHWFSDFVAGMIIGSAIGVVIGTTFKKLIK